MRGGIGLVRDHQHDHLSLFGDFSKGGPKSVTRCGVEIPGGLVGKEHLWLEEQGPCDCDSLLFTATQCFRSMGHSSFETLFRKQLATAIK